MQIFSKILHKNSKMAALYVLAGMRSYVVRNNSVKALVERRHSVAFGHHLPECMCSAWPVAVAALVSGVTCVMDGAATGGAF